MMLLAGSISDIRKHSVSAVYLIIAAAGCVLVSIPGFEPYRSFTGLLPGLFLLLFARLSAGAIGDGDALIICIIGFTFGMYAAACVLLMALLMISFYALFLIIAKKAGRRSKVALYPFLSLAFMLRLILI